MNCICSLVMEDKSPSKWRHRLIRLVISQKWLHYKAEELELSYNQFVFHFFSQTKFKASKSGFKDPEGKI